MAISNHTAATSRPVGRGALKQLAILNGGAPKTREYKQLEKKFAARIDIAAAIYNARKKKGLTQGQVARRAKLQQSLVSQIESLRGNPTFDTLESVMKVLGLKLTAAPRNNGDAGP